MTEQEAGKKDLEKEYETNVDTVSLNVERASAMLDLFPYVTRLSGNNSCVMRKWWLPETEKGR